MFKIQQTGQTRQGLLLGFTLLVSSGCSATPTASNQSVDPLHGHRSPPTGIPVPDSVKTPAAPTSLAPRSNLTPLGSDLASSNNATLAGLSTQTPLGRPLAIDDQGRALAPGQLTGGTRTTQTPNQLDYLAPNSNPKVEPIPDASAAPTAVRSSPSGWQVDPPFAAPTPTPAASPLTNTTPATAEILTRRLQERGVVNQKVEQLPGGVHLICYVSRGPEAELRILEVTAIDYMSAAQAVLQQLDTVR